MKGMYKMEKEELVIGFLAAVGGVFVGALGVAFFGSEKWKVNRENAKQTSIINAEMKATKAKEELERFRETNRLKLEDEKERLLLEQENYKWTLEKKQQRIDEISSQITELDNTGCKTEADVRLKDSLRKEQQILLDVDTEVSTQKELLAILKKIEKDNQNTEMSNRKKLQDIEEKLRDIKWVVNNQRKA